MKFDKGKFSGKITLLDGKKRKPSSKKWLTRHINDPFVKKAKEENLRSRAAFKLIEIDKKYKIFRPNDIVIDLGAAPGGWSLVAAEKIKQKIKQKIKHEKDDSQISEKDNSQIIAVDLLDFPDIENTSKIIGDFTEIKTQEKIIQLLKGKKANIIMSDIAAKTTGIKKLDNLVNQEIAQNVVDFAIKTLAKDGFLIVKLFQGRYDKSFTDTIKQFFRKSQNIKPAASRKESPEIYLVGQNFFNQKS